jgi:hypothetical protein
MINNAPEKDVHIVLGVSRWMERQKQTTKKNNDDVAKQGNAWRQGGIKGAMLVIFIFAVLCKVPSSVKP